jgi:hypothetical protein
MFFTIFVKRPAPAVEFKLEPQTTISVFTDLTVLCSKLRLRDFQELFFIVAKENLYDY